MAFSDCIVTLSYSGPDGTNILKDFPEAVSWSLKGLTPPMSDKQQKASAAIRDLDTKERDAISAELKAIEAKNKERVVAGLKAVADLELLKKPTGRRFVLVSWQDEEYLVAQGIDFASGQCIDEDDETHEYRVFLYGEIPNGVDHEHYTMASLRKDLDELPYHLVYLS